MLLVAAAACSAALGTTINTAISSCNAAITLSNCISAAICNCSYM